MCSEDQNMLKYASYESNPLYYMFLSKHTYDGLTIILHLYNVHLSGSVLHVIQASVSQPRFHFTVLPS
jgi:hypothetical protein